MNNNNIFKKAFEIEEKIKKLDDILKELNYKVYSASTSYNGIKVKNDRKIDKLEENIIKINEIENKILKNSKSLAKIEEKINNIAKNIECKTQKSIIIWRYICRYKWKDISKKAGISEIHAIREHNNVLKNLDNNSSQF